MSLEVFYPTHCSILVSLRKISDCKLFWVLYFETTTFKYCFWLKSVLNAYENVSPWKLIKCIFIFHWSWLLVSTQAIINISFREILLICWWVVWVVYFYWWNKNIFTLLFSRNKELLQHSKQGHSSLMLIGYHRIDCRNLLEERCELYSKIFV